jgi:acetylornithine/succinyldiaminopimelate/putrescine aminotransferase
MKLAKKITGRSGIVAFKNSYHGSTQGALSIIGSEYWRNAYRPLLPDILHLDYNSLNDLDQINSNTACVFAETIQAEAGILVPDANWMKTLRNKCTETGTLLVLDEIQAGFGRTGKLWGFEHFDIIPDILLLGKALGGGMPLGAFIADKKMMDQLADQPVLGHITTFGGHPVCCAAGKEALQVLIDEKLVEQVEEKSAVFKMLLVHPKIKSVRSFGLWLAVEFEDAVQCKKIIDHCIEAGIVTDWFLFAANCLRISPPLVITKEQATKACSEILKAIT